MHAKNTFFFAALVSSILCLPLIADEASGNAETTGEAISFVKEIEPIFSQHCYGCHQGAKQLGSYLMTDFDALLLGGETGEPAIVPGKPDESHLVSQITPIDGHAEMPDEPFPALSKMEVDLIRQWITEGAKNDSTNVGTATYDAASPPVYSGQPSIPSIDISPDGSILAVAGLHEVLLLDARTGVRKSRLIGMSPRINAVRFSPDGNRLAAVGGTPGIRGELQIWDLESNELTLSRSVTYDTLCGASWSPDGSKLAFGATDNVVRAINTHSGEQVLYQGAHDDWVRDTTFTPDGKHVISVARDMSCKLTEVETERFIDNITSITPGALSGGLSSVVAHPKRNEIFVGGADGVAKVYRVFRETARKIGDDANLVRKMPKLPGRIFNVAISRDATRLAAASTLNGKSEVHVWNYDFTSELSPELKAILAKRVADRNADEKKKAEQYRNSKITEIYSHVIEGGAAYAIAFAGENELMVAAADGKVRRFDATGEPIGEFSVIDVSADATIAAQPFDARSWNEVLSQRIEGAATENAPPIEQVKAIVVQPNTIELNSPYAYSQLVITAEMKDGSTRDITRLCDIDVPEFATLSPNGLIRPTADGDGTVLVSFASQTTAIKITASSASPINAEHGAVDYIRDVTPVLSRLGCNAGTCHGAQKGKNGFRLSLRGYDPVFDIRALTDDLAARRISASAPEQSLMLRKPLGLTPHQGGVLMSAGDPNHTILRRWISDGSKVNLNAPRVKGVEIFPNNPVVQQIGSKQQVRVVAYYNDGSSRDVTPEAFIETSNKEVASGDGTGLLTAVRRGEAAILARFEGAYAATTLTVMGDRSSYQKPVVETWSRIDELVAEKWDRVKVVPSELCDDATFLRRVHLDLTGLPPSSDQVREFLADATPTRIKRSRIVDALIGSEAYIEYWTNKWADLLQVNRKFLGVEGSTAFRDWIRKSVAENRPYDQIASQILTATGSNKDNPPASYFKVLRTPEDTMENTTHLFLGIRFNCNKCHDHPFERWTQDQYYEMSAYFAQLQLETDPASGKRKVGGTAVEQARPLFEKVVDKKTGDMMHPKTNAAVPPAFPFDVDHEVAPEASRRQQLAAWITDADNPYFARSYINRLWAYLLGVGLIEPIDDIRAGNPPTNPELLDYLTDSFVQSDFNIAQMQRMICNSRTYQLSVTTNDMNADDSLNYSHALPRRLPAEVIYDAVHALTGSQSQIPGMPKGTRAAALTDSGVRLADGFLQNLGRPARETACECERSSDLQLGPVMALISGPTIGTAISDPKNELERITAEFADDKQLAEEIFLRALGRLPRDQELAAFEQMKSMIQENHQQMVADLEKAEANWSERRTELEKIRGQKLAEITKQIEARTLEIKPEREKLAQEREQRIKAAEKTLADAKANLNTKLDTMKVDPNWAEWFPLSANSATASTKAVLSPQPDRSIIASGNTDKGVYTITVNTNLQNITGFRLETLGDSKLPSNGPGLADNGNFVLTEFEVFAADAKTPDKSTKQKIANGKADFTQTGFNVNQSFNGQTGNQQGWAVSGALGLTHWATFKLAAPIQNESGITLTFKMHQVHNAAKHRIGRFRISATTTGGDIPLGQPESFAALLATPAEYRSEEAKKEFLAYLAVMDQDINKANQGLAASKAAVPPDPTLVALEKRKQQFSTPTPDDPALVQLREDAKQSTNQLANIRLTAAEDLTWALINSPAFLFNH
ncbi:MAG: DUF1549 domain-containing protein [Planctomycetota bacterium]|nr:DUF1549 domain-containing protein [Planctomycetota bacterium]